jgi:hypothetical protein
MLFILIASLVVSHYRALGLLVHVIKVVIINVSVLNFLRYIDKVTPCSIIFL